MSRPRALITGGAMGIGAACALQFAESGYRVVIADVDDEVGRQTADRMSRSSFDCQYVHLDVSSADVVASTLGALGPEAFDVVIANAGIARRTPFLTMTDAQWHHTMGTNLDGAMHLFRAVLPAMVERRRGSLIAMSSISGVAYGWREHASYSASKAGIIGLVRALAVEFGPYGIRVNGIAPGYIRTAQSLSEEHSLGEAGLAAAASEVPLGRIGDPDDVADVAVFLGSDSARYLTGQVIPVDGGLLVSQS